MSLIDQAEGRTVTLLFKVKLSPPEDMPVGYDTDNAQQIAEALLKTGSAALGKTVEGQGYDVALSTAYFIF